MRIETQNTQSLSILFPTEFYPVLDVTELVVGSRPSDHYFRSVCLFVCAEFFSAVFNPIWIKLGYMLHVRV